MVERNHTCQPALGVKPLAGGLLLFEFRAEQAYTCQPRFGQTTCEGCFFWFSDLWFVKPIKPGFMAEQNHTRQPGLG